MAPNKRLSNDDSSVNDNYNSMPTQTYSGEGRTIKKPIPKNSAPTATPIEASAQERIIKKPTASKVSAPDYVSTSITTAFSRITNDHAHTSANLLIKTDKPTIPTPLVIPDTTFATDIPEAASLALRTHVRTLAARIFAIFLTILLLLLIAIFGIITVLCKGPSPSASDLFVNTVMETSAVKFLARIYFTKDEIAEIRSRNSVIEVNEVTEVSKGGENTFEKPAEDKPRDTIEIVDVNKGLFKGKMMIVHDPSRVSVATAPKFGEELDGMRLEDMMTREKAIGGINAGGFVDIGGIGKGGMPLGLVIKDGKYLAGSLGSETSVVGFDQNDKLVVGKMSGRQALDLNLRDAVSFGPVLIVNGNAVDASGSGGGLNPRTVIGQRADGAVLLLVIDGRQASSLGASFADCLDVMLEFEAVNACNLDGGSSTLMVYEGNRINVCASLYGSRYLPTAFIVK